MRRALLFCLLLGFILHAHSQTCSLSGKVVNKFSGKPIASANVFFAGTSSGVTTDKNGNYTIERIPQGKYDLVASFIGYKTFTTTLDLSALTTKQFDLYLQEEAIQLPTITINADTSGRSLNFAVFKKYFLGETLHAKKCIIKNPEDIFLYFDIENQILTAYSKKPIEIENYALGYTIVYLLKRFEMDFRNSRLLNLGIPRFEEMIPPNSSSRKKWERERKQAYSGSLIHFMRSFRQNNLQQEKFSIHPYYSKAITTDPSEAFTFASNKKSITDTRSLFKGNELQYKGVISIIYKGEREENVYQRMIQKRNNHQESLIHFNKQVKIYGNGYYGDVRNIFLEGYLAWSEKISELLPLEYIPGNTKKK